MKQKRPRINNAQRVDYPVFVQPEPVRHRNVSRKYMLTLEYQLDNYEKQIKQ